MRICNQMPIQIYTIKKVIRKMNNNKYAQKAAGYILKLGFPKSDFPEIQERLDKSCVRYQRHEYKWYQCEDYFKGNNNLIIYLIEDLYNAQQRSEAVSISIRNNLVDLIKKEDIKENIKKDIELNNFIFLENPLIKYDDFIPTDQIINQDDKQEYLLNTELGVDEQNTIFVDSDQTQIFIDALNSLQSSQLTGIDSEFTTPKTKLDENEMVVQILQISNGVKNYIFDTVALKSSEKFKDFLITFFESSQINKIGHTIKEDIKFICKFIGISQIIVRSVLDIANIHKQLGTKNNQSNLAHITETHLCKKLSKADQCSNWSTRPLRKAQLHYAALDALVCIKLYEKFSKDNEEITQGELESFQL